MIVFITLLVSLYAAGAIVYLVGVHNAPEGYEDETGFHLVWRNNDSELADVACVWGFETAQPAVV